MAELLGYRLDTLKTQLISAAPENFAKLQGKAQATKALLEAITGTSVVIPE